MKFELGFFTEDNLSSSKYFLGIWYKDIPEDGIILWVLNRDAPSWSNSCTLKFVNQSKLVIIDDGSHIRWSSQQLGARNPVLQLLDSGNLVIREAEDPNPGKYLWESFDHPADTLLPGQKIGWNLKTGLNRFLLSWKTINDPRSGNFTFTMDYHGNPEIFLRDGGGEIINRIGPWMGKEFTGLHEMQPDCYGFNFTFYRGPDEVYYKFELPPDNVKSFIVVTYEGSLQRWTWAPHVRRWVTFWHAKSDECDSYNVCGPYGVCNTSAFFHCQCPPGFEPKDPQAWYIRVGSGGCVRKTKLSCESDGFLKLTNMKSPQSTTAFVDSNLNLDQCKDMCQRNCNCTAFANFEMVEGVGNGCTFWTDHLIDMRDYVLGGQDLYVRLAASDLSMYNYFYSLLLYFHCI